MVNKPGDWVNGSKKNLYQTTKSIKEITWEKSKEATDLLSNNNPIKMDFYADEGLYEFFINKVEDSILKWEIDKNTFDNTIFISLSYDKENSKLLSKDFKWIDKAYDILKKNKNQKLILAEVFTIEQIKNLQSLNWELWNKFNFIMSHLYVEYFDLIGGNISEMEFKKWSDAIFDKETYIQSMNDVTKQKIRVIKHIIDCVKDPYSPETSDISRIDSAFEKAQKEFPSLDTKEKFLDFILNTDTDVQEKMKWEKIKWVYCDIDWTLLEYVWLHSWKDGTQNIKKDVLDMLNKYESEWKDIFIWTWGDVNVKATYLKSLWIKRPVLSKYDFAWAEAEIVIDDTDLDMFISNTKIYPEHYINTTKPDFSK